MLRFNLNLDGMVVWLTISDYVSSNREHWDDEWCSVDYSFSFQNCIDYGKNGDAVLLSCEVDELRGKIDDLLNDRIQEKQNLTFIEPDFEFVFLPKTDLRNDPSYTYIAPGHEIVDILVEWRVYLWNGGLTDNYFSTTLDREDLVALRDYLKFVEGTLTADSIEIKELIKDGRIKKY